LTGRFSHVFRKFIVKDHQIGVEIAGDCNNRKKHFVFKCQRYTRRHNKVLQLEGVYGLSINLRNIINAWDKYDNWNISE